MHRGACHLSGLRFHPHLRCIREKVKVDIYGNCLRSALVFTSRNDEVLFPLSGENGEFEIGTDRISVG